MAPNGWWEVGTLPERRVVGAENIEEIAEQALELQRPRRL